MAGVGTPKRLSYGALAAGIGGVVLIISLFLNWFSAGGFGQSGWESLKITDIVLFLLGLVAIGYALLELTGANVRLPVRREHALTVIGIIVTTLTLDILIEGTNQAIGLILATLASIAILVGGILAERRPEMALTLGGGAAAGGYAAQPGGGYPQQPVQPAQAPTAGGGYDPTPPTQPLPPAGGGATSVGTVQPEPVAPAQPVTPEPAAAPPAADWYPDPRGEKRLRYWDGAQWTDHTAD
jgi:hypothetical protein